VKNMEMENARIADEEVLNNKIIGMIRVNSV
jgi:hypothetical protein